jgi:hypothetical protein
MHPILLIEKDVFVAPFEARRFCLIERAKNWIIESSKWIGNQIYEMLSDMTKYFLATNKILLLFNIHY